MKAKKGDKENRCEKSRMVPNERKMGKITVAFIIKFKS